MNFERSLFYDVHGSERLDSGESNSLKHLLSLYTRDSGRLDLCEFTLDPFEDVSNLYFDNSD